jgi:predicted protein tyrosine phosphatase
MSITKTEQIFELTAPYNNPYQGNEPRLLFVCSVGLLRSPTCADAATKLGFNARSCGSDVGMALIPLSVNLIYWADKIIFVNTENKIQAMQYFEDYDTLIERKSIVWGVPDDYDRNDPQLVGFATAKLIQMKNSINKGNT